MSTHLAIIIVGYVAGILGVVDVLFGSILPSANTDHSTFPPLAVGYGHTGICMPYVTVCFNSGRFLSRCPKFPEQDLLPLLNNPSSSPISTSNTSGVGESFPHRSHFPEIMLSISDESCELGNCGIMGKYGDVFHQVRQSKSTTRTIHHAERTSTWEEKRTAQNDSKCSTIASTTPHRQHLIIALIPLDLFPPP